MNSRLPSVATIPAFFAAVEWASKWTTATNYKLSKRKYDQRNASIIGLRTISNMIQALIETLRKAVAFNASN